MKIFVSYTLRDGILTATTLQEVEAIVAQLGDPYIDLLHNQSINRQAQVVAMLEQASALYACVTPGFLRSEWVQFELAMARMRGILILALYPLRDLDLSTRA
jgi:hypothetical protein